MKTNKQTKAINCLILTFSRGMSTTMYHSNIQTKSVPVSVVSFVGIQLYSVIIPFSHANET